MQEMKKMFHSIISQELLWLLERPMLPLLNTDLSIVTTIRYEIPK